MHIANYSVQQLGRSMPIPGIVIKILLQDLKSTTFKPLFILLSGITG